MASKRRIPYISYKQDDDGERMPWPKEYRGLRNTSVRKYTPPSRPEPATLAERPKQTECRHEPPYPGLDTVIFCLSTPNMTCHLSTPCCPLESPHHIDECGEWYPATESHLRDFIKTSLITKKMNVFV
jgi:hypothetical protein